MSPASPDKQPIEIEVLDNRRPPDTSKERQPGHPGLQYDDEWGIAAAFFFCVNAAIVAAVLVSGAQRRAGWLDLCLYYQATMLGIWLGAGSSRFWIRGLALGLSYYYGCLFFMAKSYGANDRLCALGFWILLTALISLALRTALYWRTCRSAFWRFSLRELISGVSGLMIVIAVWSRPAALLFHTESGHIFNPLAPFARIWPIAVAVMPIALPSFFQASRWRWVAYYASLPIPILLLWGVLGEWMARVKSGILHVAPAVVTAALIVLALSYLCFSAEAALAFFGIDFAHPGAPRRRAALRRAPEPADPFDPNQAADAAGE